MSERTTRRRLLGAIAGGLAAGTAGYVDVDRVATGRRNASQAGVTTTDTAFQEESPYEEVYRETIDSVVLVQISPGGDQEGGLGSGFVYDETHVVTNDHVVGDADEAEVQFGEGEWRSAEVVGTDAHSDLAALSVEDRPDYADPLSFREEEPAIGTEVVALGNPFGLDASISRGIVSGVERLLPSPTGFSIPAATQTDAPVNPGNSGGPLVDLDGEVAGVVFAGVGQTIGFAISAALSRRVVPELIEVGEFDHPFVGVSLAPVSPRIAEANDVEATGVLVTQVVPGSPADGVLQPADEWRAVEGVPVPVGGDVIVELDGEEIPNQERLAAHLVLETSPGDVIDVGIVRDGEPETVELQLEARPDEPIPRDEPDDPAEP